MRAEEEEKAYADKESTRRQQKNIHFLFRTGGGTGYTPCSK